MREITVAEAAERFHYSVSHVRGLCESGLIRAKKFGSVWMVNKASLAAYSSVPHRTGPKRKEQGR